MLVTIEDVKTRAIAEIRACSDITKLNKLRKHYIGRHGVLIINLLRLGELPPESRPAVGKAITEAKKAIQNQVHLETHRYYENH